MTARLIRGLRESLRDHHRTSDRAPLRCFDGSAQAAGYEFDYDAVFAAAGAHRHRARDRRASGAARPSGAAGAQSEDVRRDVCARQRRASHARFGRDAEFAVGQARRAGLVQADVLNAHPLERVRAFVARKRGSGMIEPCASPRDGAVPARATPARDGSAADLRARRRLDGCDLGFSARRRSAAIHPARRSSCAATERCKPDLDPALITRAGFADDVLAVDRRAGHRALYARRLQPRRRRCVRALAAGGGTRRRNGLVGAFARYPARRLLCATHRGAKPARSATCVHLESSGPRSSDCCRLVCAKRSSRWRASRSTCYSGGDASDVDRRLPRRCCRRSTVPVLVAYGEHDAVAPRALSEEIASGDRRCRAGDGFRRRPRSQRRRACGVQRAACAASWSDAASLRRFAAAPRRRLPGRLVRIPRA